MPPTTTKAELSISDRILQHEKVFLENKRPRCLIIGKCYLMPGVSEVATEDLREGKDYLDHLIENDAVSCDQSLLTGAKQTDAGLLKTIRNTYDVRTLKGMLDGERRKNVRDAINVQLDSLAKAEKVI